MTTHHDHDRHDREPRRSAMRKGHVLKIAIGPLLVLAGTLAAHDARSGGTPRQVTPDSTAHGFASVYGNVPADQAEFLSTPDAIKGAAANGAPTLIWEALEHGEKVECLDCISAVSPLLYDGNAKTREIAAWWLRRRIFGVFGPGEVYAQTIQTLAADADPVRRSYAAYALGEFFAGPGIAACATALSTDSDARVRAAAASALGRLNDDGGGVLGTALGDSDPSVKIAALGAASRINTFSGVSAVAGLSMDPDVTVRRRAVEVLDALGAKDAVVVVAAVAQKDSDAGVRAAACHALGTFGDASVVSVLQAIAQADTDTFVQDQAHIALLRL
jgi:HEAT repeats